MLANRVFFFQIRLFLHCVEFCSETSLSAWKQTTGKPKISTEFQHLMTITATRVEMAAAVVVTAIATKKKNHFIKTVSALTLFHGHHIVPQNLAAGFGCNASLQLLLLQIIITQPATSLVKKQISMNWGIYCEDSVSLALTH